MTYIREIIIEQCKKLKLINIRIAGTEQSGGRVEINEEGLARTEKGGLTGRS